ncbi:MAG: hypothetical protein HYW77_03100 [Parcubacteria group bacterium]|nr:hypothetical protein [Parcubacteria group bacterium]
MSDLQIAQNLKGQVTNFIGVLNKRSQDVISRRFGLKNGRKETLESIGSGYKITRERVRQIEEVALRDLRRNFGRFNFNPYVQLTTEFLKEYGNALKEDKLFSLFSGNEKSSAENAALVLMMAVSNQFSRFIEDDDFNTFWSFKDPAYSEKVRNAVAQFVTFLKRSKEAVKEDNLLEVSTTRAIRDVSINDLKILISYLSLSKHIGKNIFGEWGLVAWPHIVPRGVKDKAYLVLRRENKPKHFNEIAQLINTSSFDRKKANAQTVHNELIKDDRFVLVGRGLYALAEWGYEPGTIKDLVTGFLKKKGPTPKDKIVAFVTSARFVKPNTVLLSLQDSKLFRKDEKGRVFLKEI